MIGKNGAPIEIRWARAEDWNPTMQMVWKTFMRFEADDYSEEGIENFREFITDGRIYKMFVAGHYLMMVALDEGKVVGQISARNRNHLSLLFVDEAYHKQGIGRALVMRMAEYLKHQKGEVYMSVKAAPYAVEFYRKLGFRICGPEEEHAGIRVTYMEKFL